MTVKTRVRASCAALAMLGMLLVPRAAGAACELAILLDQTGSMDAIRSSTGNSRCTDSARYAAKILNYYRCGDQLCAATTATRPVDFFIDGTTSTAFDIVYDDPANACSTTAGKRVNVFAFNGSAPFHSVTAGLPGADADGWVFLDNNSAADAVHSTILAQENACASATPLADSLCAVVPQLGLFLAPKKKLKFLTDGGENNSTGVCGGENFIGIPPFPAGTWQANTFSVISNSKWSVSTTMFGPPNFVLAPAGGGVDIETGNLLPSGRTPATDAAFFQVLATATGGKSTNVPDNVPISPLVSPPLGAPAAAVPAASVWQLALLGLGLAAGALGVLKAAARRRAIA